MTKQKIELVRHTFRGPRFEDHGLDVDVLSELIAYKTLLVETAKELWRRNHPDRERLPKNFEDSLQLKFYDILDGSATIPLMREIETGEDGPILPISQLHDELDEAVDITDAAIDNANCDQPLPDSFPKNVLPLFNNYGKTLREGESIEHRSARTQKSVTYTPETRDRLSKWSASEYEDTIEIKGEVRLADLDGCNFTMRLDDGSKIQGKFSKEQEELITNALHDHEEQRLYLKGKVQFSLPEGRPKKIISIDEMKLKESGEDKFYPEARPIWEIAMEIGSSVPEEEWAKVPRDLSRNIHHYLYGAPKEDE